MPVDEKPPAMPGDIYFVERNKDMSGVTDLARHIKARDNPSSYTPMFGRIISLPKLVIQLGNNILLDDSDIKSVFDIYETQERDNHTEYKYLGKEEAEGREIN